MTRRFRERMKRFFAALGSHRTLVAIGAAAIIHCAIVIPYFSYVPIWDAFDYLEAYLFAPRDHLLREDFFYAVGHPCFGYYWLFWIGQKLAPEQLHVVQALNLLLNCLSIAAFGGLASIAFSSRAAPIETALLTVAFAVSPVFVAYAVNMTPDTGVLAWFLATLWLISARRPGWAAVTGLMLVFCKEIGVLFYTLLVTFGLVRSMLEERRSLARLWPLAIPYLGFGEFLYYRHAHNQPYSPFAATYLVGKISWRTFVPNPLTTEVAKAGLGPFVLEYQWVFTAVIVAGILFALFQRRSPEEGAPGWLRKFEPSLGSFVFLLAGAFYVVSRTVPFENQRYFLCVYPLVLLCFFAALVQMRVGPALRVALLTAAIVVQFCCIFRTLDPVSERITGTFLFGGHPMLGIATMRQPRDTNKDVLVYNLEHTQLAYLLDEAFVTLKPTSATVFVVDPGAWRIYERIDATTFRRTVRHGSGTIQLLHLNPDELLALPSRPGDLYLLELAYFHNEKNEAKLAPFYEMKRRLTFSRNGYALSVVEMSLRPSPTLASVSR